MLQGSPGSGATIQCAPGVLPVGGLGGEIRVIFVCYCLLRQEDPFTGGQLASTSQQWLQPHRVPRLAGLPLWVETPDPTSLKPEEMANMRAESMALWGLFLLTVQPWSPSLLGGGEGLALPLKRPPPASDPDAHNSIYSADGLIGWSSRPAWAL